MKIHILYIFSILALTSCLSASKTITVSNKSDFDRINEMVEIKKSTINLPPSDGFILKDSDNNEISYQIISDKENKDEILIFQANVKANSISKYRIQSGKPAVIVAKTLGRHVPERKDDLCWENDIAAYRMFGPGLADEAPSNGVDLWLKRTNDLIIDKRYHEELQNGKTYHVDHGDGLDCYKVGHTLGAGGIAPLFNDSLWVGNFYNSFRVLNQGPLRTSFRLFYDSVKVGNHYYKQSISISLDAGSIFNKAIVKFDGPDLPMKLAGGIYLHDIVDNTYENLESSSIAYAENAISNAKIPSGRNYIAVMIPESKVEIQTKDEHLLIQADYVVGSEFTYYFGGGWSKWGFETDQAWFDAVDGYSKKLKEPLQISIK
jgi:hypothetical protein